MAGSVVSAGYCCIARLRTTGFVGPPLPRYVFRFMSDAMHVSACVSKVVWIPVITFAHRPHAQFG